MTDPRIDRAERHLDRMNSFFPRIDAKVAAVAAWLLLELGVAALNTRLADLERTWVWLPFAGFVVCVGVAGVALWRCLFPERRGGHGSLVYFARCAERTAAAFVREYLAVTDEEMLGDLAGQVWRTAEIVCGKFRHVDRAIRWATLSLGFLVAEVVATSFVHQALPRLTG